MKKEKEFLESKSTISKKENLPNGFLSSDKRISDIIGKPNKNKNSQHSSKKSSHLKNSENN